MNQKKSERKSLIKNMIFGFTKTKHIKILNPGEIQGFFMNIKNFNAFRSGGKNIFT